MRRVHGPGLTLQRMLQAQAEGALPDPPDEFRETLVLHGPAMFMEVREEVSVRHDALLGALRAAVEAGLPEGCVVELETVVLGEHFEAASACSSHEGDAGRGVNLTQVKAKPNQPAVCVSMTMTFHKGPSKGYRLVTDFPPINGE